LPINGGYLSTSSKKIYLTGKDASAEVELDHAIYTIAPLLSFMRRDAVSSGFGDRSSLRRGESLSMGIILSDDVFLASVSRGATNNMTDGSLSIA